MTGREVQPPLACQYVTLDAAFASDGSFFVSACDHGGIYYHSTSVPNAFQRALGSDREPRDTDFSVEDLPQLSQAGVPVPAEQFFPRDYEPTETDAVSGATVDAEHRVPPHRLPSGPLTDYHLVPLVLEPPFDVQPIAVRSAISIRATGEYCRRQERLEAAAVEWHEQQQSQAAAASRGKKQGTTGRAGHALSDLHSSSSSSSMYGGSFGFDAGMDVGDDADFAASVAIALETSDEEYDEEDESGVHMGSRSSSSSSSDAVEKQRRRFERAAAAAERARIERAERYRRRHGDAMDDDDDDDEDVDEDDDDDDDGSSDASDEFIPEGIDDRRQGRRRRRVIDSEIDEDDEDEDDDEDDEDGNGGDGGNERPRSQRVKAMRQSRRDAKMARRRSKAESSSSSVSSPSSQRKRSSKQTQSSRAAGLKSKPTNDEADDDGEEDADHGSFQQSESAYLLQRLLSAKRRPNAAWLLGARTDPFVWVPQVRRLFGRLQSEKFCTNGEFSCRLFRQPWDCLQRANLR